MYEDADYKGRNLRLCGDSPFTDIEWLVESIYVPEGRTVYLYNLPCFNGQNAMFEASIANISETFTNGEIFETEMLQLHGV